MLYFSTNHFPHPVWSTCPCVNISFLTISGFHPAFLIAPTIALKALSSGHMASIKINPSVVFNTKQFVSLCETISKSSKILACVKKDISSIALIVSFVIIGLSNLFISFTLLCTSLFYRCTEDKRFLACILKKTFIVSSFPLFFQHSIPF